jgi:hypothetical protein
MKNKYKRNAGENQTPRSTPTGAVVFNPDYTPVIRDLKRIGVLAGIFIAILIGLAFAMPYIMP